MKKKLFLFSIILTHIYDAHSTPININFEGSVTSIYYFDGDNGENGYLNRFRGFEFGDSVTGFSTIDFDEQKFLQDFGGSKLVGINGGVTFNYDNGIEHFGYGRDALDNQYLSAEVGNDYLEVGAGFSNSISQGLNSRYTLKGMGFRISENGGILTNSGPNVRDGVTEIFQDANPNTSLSLWSSYTDSESNTYFEVNSTLERLTMDFTPAISVDKANEINSDSIISGLVSGLDLLLGGLINAAGKLGTSIISSPPPLLIHFADKMGASLPEVCQQYQGACSPTRSMVASYSPVDIKVTTPDGKSISPTQNNIKGAFYNEYVIGGEMRDAILLSPDFDYSLDELLVEIEGDSSATTGDIYSLVYADNSGARTVGRNLPVSNGQVDSFVNETLISSVKVPEPSNTFHIFLIAICSLIVARRSDKLRYR